MQNSNDITKEIFISLINFYSAGNVKKFAELVEKDRSYIEKLYKGKHSIGIEKLYIILLHLEPNFKKNKPSLIELLNFISLKISNKKK